MKICIATFVVGGLFVVSSIAPAQAAVFFEENFDGPTLDSSIWRTEILTSGVRWCDSHTGAWWDQGTRGWRRAPNATGLPPPLRMVPQPFPEDCCT